MNYSPWCDSVAQCKDSSKVSNRDHEVQTFSAGVADSDRDTHLGSHMYTAWVCHHKKNQHLPLNGHTSLWPRQQLLHITNRCFYSLRSMAALCPFNESVTAQTCHWIVCFMQCSTASHVDRNVVKRKLDSGWIKARTSVPLSSTNRQPWLSIDIWTSSSIFQFSHHLLSKVSKW